MKNGDEELVDYRENAQSQGAPNKPMWAAIAPFCRHQEGNGLYKIQTYFLHKDWNGEHTKGNDVAVVLLEEGSSFYQGPFPTFQTPFDLDSLDDLTLLGWGYVNEYEADPQDQQALFGATVRPLQQVHLQAESSCDYVPQDQFCAVFIQAFNGDNGDSCGGDSGGPLLLDRKSGNPIQVGIVSWGWDSQCRGEDDYAGIYTQVSQHADWIGLQIQSIINQINPPEQVEISSSPPPPSDAYSLGDSSGSPTYATSEQASVDIPSGSPPPSTGGDLELNIVYSEDSYPPPSMTPEPTESTSASTSDTSIPDQVQSVNNRCSTEKCCISWTLSDTSEANQADYFVVAVEYKSPSNNYLTSTTNLIDYSIGLRFAGGQQGQSERCLIFEGLQSGTFYRFQVVGVNENGFGKPSQWSNQSRTRSSLLSRSSFAADCGCSVQSIDKPVDFDFNQFQTSFPGNMN
eukprot:TRINITY_DN115_c0_g1_i4.p2 TRINITY_DN115_c0_g1~~TRINITY_DN115_c0_g1_i4.p2  ORF type:complete len:458 (+),score=31.11 TRINITY_DN115_c0_g1_i4:440-1813(+)